MADINSFFKFKYRPDQDFVEISKIINVGSVSPAYGDIGGVSPSIHVWATNVSSFNIYNPGLYILHQDYESKTPTSKPTNVRQLLTASDGNVPFLSVKFTKDSYLDYFDFYRGTKNNPIRITSLIGGTIMDRGLLCIPIGNTIEFWIGIINSTNIIGEDGSIQLQKNIDDGLCGISLRMTGDIHG